MNDAPDVIKHILDLYAGDTTLKASDPDLSVLEQKIKWRSGVPKKVAKWKTD